MYYIFSYLLLSIIIHKTYVIFKHFYTISHISHTITKIICVLPPEESDELVSLSFFVRKYNGL